MRPLTSKSRPLSRRQALKMIGAAGTAGIGAACGSASTSDAGLDGPLHYASLLDVARAIATGAVSPVELTEHMLDRIGRVDSRLNCYVTVMGEQALAAAAEARADIEAGVYRGPLHGMPVAVKDLCYTAGVRTMGGLSVLSGFVPDFDGTAVVKLREAGAVLLGKLALTEGAMGGYHPDFKIPVNPWKEGMWTGASSSGSGAAPAAGLCFASLGTDTGGSIRFPSMANGIVGLKPTYGRVSRYGVVPLAETLDHVGPMARRVADAAVVLEAISGRDPEDPTSLGEPAPGMLEDLEGGVDGMRIGWDRTYATDGVDSGLVSSIEAALGELDRLGAAIVEVTMPRFGEAEEGTWFTLCSYEAHAAHAVNFPSRADEFGPYFRNFLEMGAAVSDEAYAEAAQQRAAFNDLFHPVLESVDAVAVPAGGAPFPVNEAVLYGSIADFDSIMPNVFFRFTLPADFAGTPALVVPCGVSESGVPHTIQFFGRRLSEAHLCRIGHTYEQATGWHELHPDL